MLLLPRPLSPSFWIGIGLFLGIVSFWGEGSDTFVGVRRITLVMKTHELEPGLVYGPQHAQRVCKRSFRRAQRRAHHFGVTWYKGRIFTATDAGPLPPTTLPSPSKPPSQNVPPPPRTLRRRLTLFSWNAGALSPASWDLAQQWLDDHEVDIFAVQETHWPFTREWTSPISLYPQWSQWTPGWSALSHI